MRITLLSAALIAAASAWAFPEASRLNLPPGSHHPVLSPDGNTVLFSTDVHTGLSALNLKDGSIKQIDGEAAAGFQPVFSTDGNTVYYRTATTVDGLLYRDVRSFNMAEGEGTILAAPSRDYVDMPAMAGADYAVADYRNVKTVINGQTKLINPLADSHSYLWASLSPDQTHLMFTEPFQGVFVSNVDGSQAVKVLDKGDFASWAGNRSIIAVVTHDDGYVVLDSQLVLVNINTGIITPLTPETVKVGEATASASGKVVYSDLQGNMFIIDLNKL